jgi:hypothetical protein
MKSDPIMTTVVAIWIAGYVAIVIAKHTVFSDTWGSHDLSLHWHYWAWQAAWTVLVLWGGGAAVARFRRP